MTTPNPELFTNVHKGIRRALFEACLALGRASGDPVATRRARGLLDEALHFVEHHGHNEDAILLPTLAERSPELHARMQQAHTALDREREALREIDSIEALYLATCAFTGRYLEHMDHEERVFEPLIHGVLKDDEAASFGRRSVERTLPDDQRRMLGWMLPAMPERVAHAFLERLPAPLAAELRERLASS